MFSKGISGPYIIAEVGQNHQGDLDTAREFIKIFSQLGANAIKFQNRDNKYLFSDDAYNKPYDSPTSFAPTYGEHREKLELDKEAFLILKEDCRKYNVDFMSTPFDEPSLNHLIDIDVDVIKISSFDLGNLSFINRIAKTKKPLVMSIGGGNIEQIKSSISTISNHHKNLAILHCVSEYPCEYDRLGLSNIETLTKKYPDFTIGSSDHFNGTISGPIAFMMGAKVFEKHVTLNRASKGTDHSFALEPEGFRKFCRDIRRVPQMMKQKPEDEIGNEPVFKKLGKSLIANQNLKKGDVLSLDNLSGKIFKDQILPVRQSNEIIGKKINKDIKMGEAISLNDIQK